MGKGSAMTQIYRFGLAFIYLACCGAGMVLGYTWGIGGSILGIVLGAMVASMLALLVNTPERMEAAFYSILAIVFVVLVVYLIVAFWGVRF